MKTLYVARVIVVSFEMLILLICGLLILNFDREATELARTLRINDDLYKYMAPFTFALLGWVIKAAKDLIFSDEQDARHLVKWEYYWKLKAHVHVSLIYALFFCLVAAVPMVTTTVSDGKELILLCTGVIGSVWVAASVYLAQMSVKEILIAINGDR